MCFWSKSLESAPLTCGRSRASLSLPTIRQDLGTWPFYICRFGLVLEDRGVYNFAIIPKITDRDQFWVDKESGKTTKPVYEDITMPKNTAAGIYISGFVFLIGFAFVWHIIWLGVLGLIGTIIVTLMRTFDDETEYIIPAAEVAKIEAGRNHNA